MVTEVAQPLGQLFLRMVFMSVLPLIFLGIRKSWLERGQSSPASIMLMSVEMSAP